jgi:hypothetical protein
MRLRPIEPAWVAGYVGLPFLWRGRDRDGLDCWGLVRLVYLERFGIALPSFEDGYAAEFDKPASARRVFDSERLASGRWEPAADDAQVGDIAVFRAAGVPHVGLLIARDPVRMLHAIEGTDSCVERVDAPAWSARHLETIRHTPAGIAVRGRSRSLVPGAVDVVLPAGGSIDDLLRSAGVSPAPEMEVFVGLARVPRDRWAHVRPKPGRLVRVAVAPGGGGGQKNPLRLVLTILTIAAVAVVPGAIFAAAGTTAAAASAGLKIGVSLITAGVGLGGALLANALAPPPRTGVTDQGQFLTSPTLTGSRNTERPYAPFPVVLGRHRIAPVFAARPYTEIAGDDQYLRQLFAVSIGPTEITDAKIGETPLEQFDGVELEIRRGNPNQRPSRLYAGQVLEQGLAVALTSAASWQTRTSDLNADELSVDIAFAQGLVRFDDQGRKQTLGVDVEVNFRRVGTTPWKSINANGGVDGSPDTEAELDVLFRTPEVSSGGRGVHTTAIGWGGGAGFPAAKPGYLPADRFSWMVEGLIEIPQTGSYQFGLDSSDAADIEIDGEIVCGYYGTHPTLGTAPTPNFTAATGTRTLTEGLHTFRARVEARSTAGAIAVGWRKPGDASITLIPASAFKRSVSGSEIPGLQYTWFRTNQYRSVLSTTASRSEQIRRSLAWAVPRGQYEVRLRRTTADRTGDREFDAVTWTALRTIRKTPAIRQTGVASVGLRIRATDQLQGVVDEFNCVAGSICPDYDSGTGRWIRRVTSNPASLYRYVLQHPANPRPVPDNKIDLATLQAWHGDCASKGLEFNAVIDYGSTLFDVLQAIASAGRASPAIVNGLHSVVRDRVVSTPVQHFTPRNSFGFRGRKAFADLPHAARVRFLNRDKGYQPDERVVLRDGFQIDGLDAFGGAASGLPPATTFEPLDLFGCVTADQAFKQGRFFLAAAELRPEVYELSTAIEHLACTRGDPVMLTHDVPLLGLAYGRIVGLVLTGSTLTGLRVDSACPMGSVGTFRIRVRLEDGSSFTSDVLRVPGEQLELTLSAGVPDTQPRPKVGDLFAFGPTGQESRLCIVKSIEVNQELGATLQLVDAANAIHSADTGTIPPYDSGITKLPTFADPPEPPVIETIRSDDWVMVRDADGSLRNRMLITLKRASGARPTPTKAVVRFRPKPPSGQPEGPWLYTAEQPIDDQQVSVLNVDEGVTYQLAVRVITPAGKTSTWVSTEHTVVGKVNPPPNVSTFDVVRLSDGTRQYRWTFGPVPPDIAGVVIRYGPPGSTWDAMTPIAVEVLQSSPTELNDPPAGAWRFAIRAIDTSGNLSTSITYIDRTLGAPSLEGVAVSDDARFAGWPGTKTGCAVRATGELEANDSAAWTTPASWTAFTRWNTSPTTPIVYEHPAVDGGVVFDFSPDVQFTAIGSATVEVAWSVDGTTWSAWTAVSAVRNQSVSARYLRARITVAATGPAPVPAVLAFTVLFRAVARSIELQDINTAALGAVRVLGVGDVRLPVPPDSFTAIRFVSVSFNGTGQGWSFQVVDRDRQLGPRVQLFDSTGRKRHATIDAIIRGV